MTPSTTIPSSTSPLPRFFRSFLGLCALGAIFILAACSTAETPEPIPEGLGTFVGEVTDDLFIAVAIAEHPDEALERAFMVYLCDGADRSTWLIAESESDTATLQNSDVEVVISSTGATVSGRVTFAGQAPQQLPQYTFEAQRAEGDAGLFRLQRVGPPGYTGGWIILNTLEQRGALTENGTIIENPFLDVATGTAETSVGTFSDITQLPCIPVPRWGCIPLPN